MISRQRMEFIIIDKIYTALLTGELGIFEFEPFRNKPLIRNRSEPKIIEETIFHCNSVSLPCWCQIAGSGGGRGGGGGGGRVGMGSSSGPKHAISTGFPGRPYCFNFIYYKYLL